MVCGRKISRSSRRIDFLEGVTNAFHFDYIAVLERALVIGLSQELNRQTGNPVQIRDGPAAVTENFSQNHLVGHCLDFTPLAKKLAGVIVHRVRRPFCDWLGSQKTYQRVGAVACREGRPHTTLSFTMRW